MVNNIEITEFLLSQVKKSTEVSEYCNSEFNRSLMQLVGVDINNAPDKADAPFLIYEPIIKNIGNQESEFEYEFYLRLVVQGDDEPEIDGDIARYKGIYQIEKLGNLIIDAIKKGIDCNTNLEVYEINFYHDEISVFPLYSGTVILRFSVPHVIGQNQISFKGE